MRDEFSEPEKRGVYRAIYERRDVRAQFRAEPIPDAILHRLLDAAHHAGSVGFMQPWNFIVIRDQTIRRRVHEAFLAERERDAARYQGNRQQLFRSLKLEGILESALNLCVTCDRSRGGPHVLGRSSILDTDFYSTCCAVQNFWLAARAEGIGVGWVSILRNDELAAILGIPDGVVPVAYLCVGYVTVFPPRPELEAAGWRGRIPLEDLVFYERWGHRQGAAVAIGPPRPEIA